MNQTTVTKDIGSEREKQEHDLEKMKGSVLLLAVLVLLSSSICEVTAYVPLNIEVRVRCLFLAARAFFIHSLLIRA